jgi:glycosyltransferase involved in cell wall biosynthesis
MPPRVAFWTGAFRPNMEAIAWEVSLLRELCSASVAWGLHPHCWAHLSLKPNLCLHPRLHLAFRAITQVLEPLFQTNHIVGSMADWFYLAPQRWRPTVLTQAGFGKPSDPTLMDRVDRVVVECPRDLELMKQYGIGPDRLRLIYPPVNLERFRPAPALKGRFTILFASSPDDETWLEARGLGPLLDAAALRPAMRFRLLWRPWGNCLARMQHWIAQRGLANVELVFGHNGDMPVQYQGAHACVAPFTQQERCKPAPNSLIESMACGRPVLATRHVGLADLIREEKAGVVCEANGPALAEGCDRLQADWAAMAQKARRLAERLFSQRVFLAGYEMLYGELTCKRTVLGGSLQQHPIASNPLPSSV